MRKPTRSALTAVSLTAAVTAVIVLPAAPALADSTSCSISNGVYSCSTGTVRANSVTHSVRVIARKAVFGGSVTCRVHDSANGVTVGQVKVSAPQLSEYRTIGGLYGRYFAVCINGSRNGGGGDLEN